MPIEVLNNSAQTTITGGVTISKDTRTGDAGNLTVSGTASVSGATVIGSNLVVSGTASVSGITTHGSNLVVSGTVTVTGSTVLGSSLVVSGTESVTGSLLAGSDMKISGQLLSPMPQGSASNNVQLLGTSSAGVSQTITMTGSGRIIPVSFTNTSTISIGLTPTLSTSVSDGAEITILNISPSGTNLVVPSSLQGSISGAAIVTVSAMQGARFVYSALLQSWLRAN